MTPTPIFSHPSYNFQVSDWIATGMDDNRLRDKTTDYTVDTVFARDTGSWETGIERFGREWVIVEEYPDEERAKAGHKKWLDAMVTDPKQPLPSVQFEGMDEVET